MSEGTVFCMNCGNKVETIQKLEVVSENSLGNVIKICKKCGKQLDNKSIFCPSCGEKQVIRKKVPLLVSVIIVVMILLLATGINVYINSMKSPIEGVSKKIYLQGMEYLETMESSTTKEAVTKYALNNEDEKLNDIYLHIDTVDFQVELGNKPTEEEIYFAKVITKFWESWAICYSHESVITKYEDSSATGVQIATSIYKGLVSEFKDGIAEAKETLKEASNISGMKKSYKILTDIWDGDN